MALELDGQVSVNGLVMGRGTPYKLLQFNPWSRDVRHDQQPQASGTGAWSGREDLEAAAVPFKIRTLGSDAGSWLRLHRRLLRAFRASHTDVELRYRIDGVEYLMFGRPRMVAPEIEQLGTGEIVTSAAFMALDPRHYSATLQSQSIGLPSTSGGLTVPFTVPFVIPSTVTAGRMTIENEGTEETGLLLVIEALGLGLVEPRVTFTPLGGEPLTLRFSLTLAAGQWLEVDTERRTVYLNGTASRRGQASGDWFLLPGGDGETPAHAELAFNAAAYSAVARLTASWRHTW